MRWRFFDPNSRSEAAEHEALVAKIDSWWREFQSKTKEIDALFSQKAKWDLEEWMARHLQDIDSALMWEYGPAVRSRGHRLVITPESANHLRPLVRAILARAPTIDGWEFYEYRLAENVEQACLTVQGRTGCDIGEFKVKAMLGEQQRVELIYTSPSISHAKDQSALNAAFVATETLLGEQCLDHWIGAIEIAPFPGNSGLKRWFGGGTKELSGFLGLDRLQETVSALVGSMRDQCPPKPHYEWVEGAEWTMWQLKPQQDDDYVEQQDLFVGKSANPKMWMAAHKSGLFCSEQFSRCGETFCYVKIDGSQGLDNSSFADKSEIEDALDLVLKPVGLGCHIGGGTGLRYSYIDLAITNVDQAIQAIKERLRLGKVPKRSWIQFFDSDLAVEWVGIYDDTPQPPLAMNQS